jgi:TP901 family phage tail tape measure protein
MTKATGLVKTFAARASVAFRQLAHTATRWMRRIAFVVTATIAASIRELAKFEEQMANVSTMLSDQHMYLMPEYRREVQRMSVQFGEATGTIAFGLYQLLSASMAPEKALKILRASMIAARAGMTDTATAADIITTALNAYGFEAKYAGLISDRLFAIVKRGKTTFGELASSMGTILPNASLVGAKIEVIGAALSTATRSGVSMATAVQDLNFLVTSFLKPTEKAAAAAKKFDFELKASTLEGEGLLTVLRKLNGENSKHRKATAEDIAAIGQRRGGMRALSIITQKATEVDRDYRESLESTGISHKQWGKVSDNLMLKLRQFWQLLKDIMRNALQPFADDLKALIDYTIAHRDEIIAWVKSVTGKLDEFVEYLQGGFADGAKAGFEVLKEVARTTGEALIIIFQETFAYIGKNIAGWMWKGITTAPLQFRKMAGQMAQRMLRQFAYGIQDAVEGVVYKVTGQEEDVSRIVARLAARSEQERAPTLGGNIKARLDELYAGLPERIEAIKKKHRELAPEMQALVNHAKKVGQAFKDVFGGILQGAETTLPEVKAFGDDATNNMEEVTDKWKVMWEDASGSIAGAMENAFADIVEDARNARRDGECLCRYRRRCPQRD